ncbi:MAG: hypothetical protein HS111_30840 [Kofleriaceae bacterium]|nr:hypothetical protein [Kofleriaceae bacterium]
MRQRRAGLADQLERAATSVALNLARGRRPRRARPRASAAHRGRRDARGARRAAVAAAWGYLDDATLAPATALADRLGGVVHGLIRRLG